MRRAAPPKRPPNTALPLLLLVGLLAAGVALAGLWRTAAGVGRNLDALVVTPAPTPPRPAAAGGPLLVLPGLPTAASGAPAPAGALRPVTVLLLGSDRRPGETAIPRTDTIIVVRADPTAGRVALLSLPRDLWVPIPGHGENRISNAYLWGERDGPPGAGLALARATVGDLLGLPIDYVALADLRGFAAVVDAVGGVQIDVPAALVDTRFPTDDYRTTTVRFRAGPQLMDGDRALVYARMRHPDSDFERAQRQQTVLLAIGERLRARGYLANALAAEQISAALVGHVQTDMPREQIAALAWALRDLDAASVERYALGEDDVRFGVGADRFAQTALPGVLGRLVAWLMGE